MKGTALRHWMNDSLWQARDILTDLGPSVTLTQREQLESEVELFSRLVRYLETGQVQALDAAQLLAVAPEIARLRARLTEKVSDYRLSAEYARDQGRLDVATQLDADADEAESLRQVLESFGADATE
jgi:hypothetical protein